jgi:hypothetical protein
MAAASIDSKNSAINYCCLVFFNYPFGDEFGHLNFSAPFMQNVNLMNQKI